MADHPLRPATHRCLGGPLPHQPANGTRAHPQAINLSLQSHAKSQPHSVLAPVSRCYSQLEGRLLTCSSPFRHSYPKVCVRLACLINFHTRNRSPQCFSLLRTFDCCIHFELHFSIKFLDRLHRTIQFSNNSPFLAFAASIKATGF